MKKLIQKGKFLFRLAYKNIISTKLRSIILFITFIILLFLSIIAFSTKPFLYDYYHHYHFGKYKNIDLYLTYDENSSVRFFSIRELINNINIEEDFNFIAPFFETTSLIELKDNDLSYVKIMAGNIEALKNINHHIPDDLSNINANEIIITTTISELYNVRKNDNIKLFVGNEAVNFKIIEIIKDDGLLYGETVFIDKDSYISSFLNASGKNYGLTKNIYNTVYFDIKDKSKIQDIKNEIESIPYYRDLHLTIKETFNNELIQESVGNISSLFYLAYIFILFAIILVLQSTLTLIFEERKSQIGIIKILGGNNRFSFIAILIEFLIYSLPAIIISYLIGNLIVNSGLKYIGSSLRYQIPLKSTIYGTLLVFFGIIIITTYNYLRIFKTSHIKLSTNHRINYKENSLINFIIFLISIILLISIKYIKLDIEVKALIYIILAFILIFLTCRLLLTILKYILKYKKRKNLFTLISPNVLNDNKIVKQVINVLIISFIIIVFLSGLRDYIYKRGNLIKDNINIDIAITNVVNKMDVTYNELKEHENISSIDKAYLYKNVYIKEVNAVFWYNVSVDANKINNYFNIHVDSKIIDLLNDKNTPYILLPIKYHYIYDLNIGDKVTLTLNNSYDNEEFHIVDFIDIGISDFIITNINVLNKYKELNPNSILLNLNNNDKDFRIDFIKEYNKNMYQVIDFNLLIGNMINLFYEIMQYLIYIIIVMIICFMLTIFNNSILQFNNLKPLYSRLRVLGCPYQKLTKNIIYEILVIALIISLSIIIMLPIINNNFHYLLLFFNSYEKIYINSNSTLIGFILAVIMYFISYLYYFHQLKNLNYSNILKKF